MLARAPIQAETIPVLDDNSGVTECRGFYNCELSLEAWGPTREAVAARIARYMARTNRFNIRFYDIRNDDHGGYLAHGLCTLEAI